MKPYLKDASLVCSQLQTTENGLSSSQVEQRRQQYGENKLKEKKKKSEKSNSIGSDKR